MRPAQLRRFARGAGPPDEGRDRASMRPAQLRRFANAYWLCRCDCGAGFNEAGAAAPVCRFCRFNDYMPRISFNEAGAAAPVCRHADRANDRRPAASMRPAQLRRFADHRRHSARHHRGGFNEAGAAAPVCPQAGHASGAVRRRFNEAGAAAPVCLRAGGRGGTWKAGFNEAGAAAPVCPGDYGLRYLEELALQ